MSNSTYFCQECPTCGRNLQIRVEHLGRKVQCQHCSGTLIARDPATARYYGTAKCSTLLERADKLLESVAEEDEHRPTPNPR